MKRGVGFHGGFGRRKVGLAGTVVLLAGLAAGPGMLAARSAVPAGQIERVSVTGSGGERNAPQDTGRSLACPAPPPRRCTKRSLSDDGPKVAYSAAAGHPRH